MAEQRPIVYFQRLMGNYDRQVAEIMKAKREYLVFAEDESEAAAHLIEREPVTVEVLTPKPVLTQAKTKKIVELNAPLEDQELFVTEPEIETPVVAEVTTPERPPVEPVVMTPNTPLVEETPVTPEPVVETETVEAVPEKEPVVEEPKTKAKPMTGLGLNLDSIFNEEFSAEQTGYFGK